MTHIWFFLAGMVVQYLNLASIEANVSEIQRIGALLLIGFIVVMLPRKCN